MRLAGGVGATKSEADSRTTGSFLNSNLGAVSTTGSSIIDIITGLTGVSTLSAVTGVTGVTDAAAVTGVTLSTLSVMVGRNFPEVIFCSSPSRTESFIIQPQDGQIESVGAKS